MIYNGCRWWYALVGVTYLKEEEADLQLWQTDRVLPSGKRGSCVMVVFVLMYSNPVHCKNNCGRRLPLLLLLFFIGGLHNSVCIPPPILLLETTRSSITLLCVRGSRKCDRPIGPIFSQI